jgi:hypothetical protein
VLVCFERGFSHWEVQRVGGANVHHIDFGIGQQVLVIPGGVLNSMDRSELPRAFGGSARYRNNVHHTEAAQSFQVNPAHEAGSKDGDFYFVHNPLHFLESGKVRRTATSPAGETKCKLTQPAVKSHHARQKHP